MMGQVDYAALDLAGKRDVLVAQMRALRSSILYALQAGNQAAVDGLKAQLRSTAQAFGALADEALRAEMPSDFMRSLSDASDEIVAIGKTVGVEVGTVAKAGAAGLRGLLGALPVIVIGALIVGGLAFASKMRPRTA